ncbi:MAG TPA: hypothetical protein VG965_06120 [Patescibacteria group bacterium]|nr:hypothetical protein [Patescibacteria group bacterium]
MIQKIRNLFQNFNFKKNWIFIACGIAIFITLVLAIFLLLNKPKVAQNEPAKGNKTSKTAETPSQKVYFNYYTEKQPSSSVAPVSVSKYILKSNFTTAEAFAFGNKFGLDQLKETAGDPNVVFDNLVDPEKRGIMQFNKSSGEFNYRSYGDFKISTINSDNISSSTPIDMAQSVIKSIGLADSFLSCQHTYKKTGYPSSVTFVECHRTSLGLPVVNLGGALNLPVNKPISQILPGVVENADSPQDKNIISESSGLDGLARPNSFNTITIAVTSDGSLLSIDSNIRWILNSEQIKSSASADEIISTDEALASLKSHKALYSFTVPDGSGATDLSKVYPDDQAKATYNNAVIYDVGLIYLDKPTDVAQDTYVPYYLVRGSVELDSGYNVKFAQVVPALRSDLSMVSNENDLASNTASGEQVLGQQTIQMRSFSPSITQVTPTSQPSIAQQTNSPAPQYSSTPPADACIDENGGDINNLIEFDVEGYGQLVVAPSGTTHSYYVYSDNPSDINIDAVRDAFFKVVAQQYAINVARANPSLTYGTDLDQLFDTMNKNCSTYAMPAPMTSSCMKQYGGLDGGASFETKYVSQVLSDTKSILNDAMEHYQYSDWVKKPDLFPSSTVDTIQNLFLSQGSVGNCYITGVSPHIFVYSQKPMQLSLTTDFQTTYTSPSYSSNNPLWNFTVSSNSNLKFSNDINYSNIYYEFDPKKIHLNSEGEFTIDAGNWRDEIIDKFSKPLGLNNSETNALISDTQGVISNLPKEKFLSISLVSQDEMSNKLPILVDPAPQNTFRMILKVSSSNKEVKNYPVLQKIKRDGLTIVELGAISK